MDRILGMDTSTFYALILLLLLIILGIVSFNYYAYVNAKDGIRFGTGFEAGILGGRGQQQMQTQTGYY